MVSIWISTELVQWCDFQEEHVIGTQSHLVHQVSVRDRNIGLRNRRSVAGFLQSLNLRLRQLIRSMHLQIRSICVVALIPGLIESHLIVPIWHMRQVNFNRA